MLRFVSGEFTCHLCEITYSYMKEHIISGGRRSWKKIRTFIDEIVRLQEIFSLTLRTNLVNTHSAMIFDHFAFRSCKWLARAQKSASELQRT